MNLANQGIPRVRAKNVDIICCNIIISCYLVYKCVASFPCFNLKCGAEVAKLEFRVLMHAANPQLSSTRKSTWHEHELRPTSGCGFLMVFVFLIQIYLKAF